MSQIILETHINAPAEICFDLMRDIRIHAQTTAQTNEKTVAGVTDGMISVGQTVTFEGTHFGIRQRLTVKVVEFDRPRLFVDEMTEGSFKTFKHRHEFFPQNRRTLMRDTLTWTSPFGNPPLQVTVTPCDRVMFARAARLVKASGVCTLTATLKLPTSFPPEPVNVYVPAEAVTEPAGRGAW